jgi:FMN reductase
MLEIKIVIGNPSRNSRTRRVAESLVARLFGSANGHNVEVVELADYANELFLWESESVRALTSRVAESDVVVLATPTYKASYTGLLKAFLDRYQERGLQGLVVIPVMTGGSLAHSLAPVTTLIPLLAELGAVVPGRGLYFVTDGMDRIDELIDKAAKEIAGNLASASAVAANV